MKELMLTTIDNPFNPFTDFDEWFAFDSEKGYNTCQVLANNCFVSSNLPDNREKEIRREAIQELVEENLLGIYKIVEEP